MKALVYCLARWRNTGDRLSLRREESPDFKGGTLGNAQAEQSDTGTTENRPPMAAAMKRCGAGKGETVG